MVFCGRSRCRFVPVLFLCVLLLLPVRGLTEPGVDQDPFKPMVREVREFTFPPSMRLCGETLDLEDPMNMEMFDREFTIIIWDIPQVFMWLKRTGRFFPYFEERLAEEGLPEDLKYLAVAESSLHTHIKSKAGALGIWQLMEDTARRNGLHVDRSTMDERLCYVRSTDGALSYLKTLKQTFKTWLLAMAAYNCGENKLNKALKNQSGSDYFSLDLPRETERYVFRIAAIKLVMENAEEYGFRVDTKRVYKPHVFETVEVHIKDRFYVSDISDLTGIPYKDFMEFNPKFLSPILPLGKYTLHLPPKAGASFFTALEKLNDPAYRKKHSYDSRYYVVQPGDVLSNIAWETGVSVRMIRKLNRLKGSMIYPGQKLLIRK